MSAAAPQPVLIATVVADRSSPTQLRVVPRPRQEPSNRRFLILCGALLVAGLIGLLVVNTTIAQGAFTLGDLTKKSDELHDQELELTASLQQLSAPQRLAAEAAKMGMVPSQHPAFLRLSDGKVFGDSRPNGPDPSYHVVTTTH